MSLRIQRGLIRGTSPSPRSDDALGRASRVRESFIAAAKRTPIGRIGGILRTVQPEQLVVPLIRALLSETGLDGSAVDDVILGNVVGPGGNLGRLAALAAGLSIEVPGVTVDRQCGSGLEAINLGAAKIRAGLADMVIAGGAESCSLEPWKLEKPSSVYKEPPRFIYPHARFSPTELGDPDMGIAAENVAEAYDISREDQDAFALASHQKAARAITEGRFKNEIEPVPIARGMGHTMGEMDECVRPGISMEMLRRFPPIFKPHGSVTAGNSCPTNDGAALVIMVSQDIFRRISSDKALRFVDCATAGVDPNLLGIGPVPAVRKLLARRQLAVDDIDLFEFNEAFASQVLASVGVLGLPMDRLNVNGGAIALGHPYGASGAVLVTRLFHELHARNKRYGVATLGIAGGMGIASLFERV
ncbi:MAG: thiolase family protein [Chloroflexota bacterium]|nr:MAG: thiolase family protein [Chloroflexota bacterium]